MSSELSVVVPVHNEAANLPGLLAEIRSALDGVAEYEIVCVDDGSDDETTGLLTTLPSEFPRLRVVRHRAPAGQSSAIAHGVAAARGAWIATLDGDGQNDPADIPRLLALVRAPGAPADLRLLVGERSRRQDPWIKRIAGRAANAAHGVLIDTDPLTGPPAQAVVESGSGALMLVVGSRGAGAFAALLLGSVSRYAASHALCPVVVVRREHGS